jgi:hypothetical protein
MMVAIFFEGREKSETPRKALEGVLRSWCGVVECLKMLLRVIFAKGYPADFGSEGKCFFEFRHASVCWEISDSPPKVGGRYGEMLTP